MPITANYGWTTPVVNADFGAWGGKLNTAFDEVDADMKALADVVSAGIANVARTNVANTFSATQTFANVLATSVLTSGAVTAGTVLGGKRVTVEDTTRPNDAQAQLASFLAGTQGLYLSLFATPSAAPLSRITEIWSGDNTAFRRLALRASNTFIGAGAPTFTGFDEALAVGGVLFASGDVRTTGGFYGNGANITSIPSSAVSGLDGALANRALVGHGHSAADITSGTLPWTRIANPVSIPFDASSVNAFGFVTGNIEAPGGSVTSALNRPAGDAAFPLREWQWVRVSMPGKTAAWMPVWTGASL